MGSLFGRLAVWIFAGLGIHSKFMRFFFLGLFASMLIIVIHNVIISILRDLIEFAITRASAVNLDIENQSMQLTGAAGYLAYKLRLADCVAFLFSCLSLRITLKAIPFIRVN